MIDTSYIKHGAQKQHVDGQFFPFTHNPRPKEKKKKTHLF